MLAIARILRTGARYLLLDEPTEGLAPVIVQQIARTVREIKARGFTVLLVEQNLRFAQSVADRHYVMEHGRVVDTMTAEELCDAKVVTRTEIGDRDISISLTAMKTSLWRFRIWTTLCNRPLK